jgi:hypothetical protein
MPRYLRIPNFPSVANLSLSTLGPWFALRNNEFMGDYDRMVCAGSMLHIPHTSKDADGSWNVYSNRVDVCSVIADVNSDSAVDVADATLFTTWYSTSAAPADLNRDGTIDGADVQLFCTSYACGCNP